MKKLSKFLATTRGKVITGVASAVCTLSAVTPAFAADPTESAPATVADMITSSGTAIGSVLQVVWKQITINPLLSLFIGFSIVGVGIAFFTALKHA